MSLDIEVYCIPRRCRSDFQRKLRARRNTKAPSLERLGRGITGADSRESNGRIGKHRSGRRYHSGDRHADRTGSVNMLD